MKTNENTVPQSAKPAKQAKPATPAGDAIKPSEEPAKPAVTGITISGRTYRAEVIQKHVNSYLADYGRAKLVIARFASQGKIDASLQTSQRETTKAVTDAAKSGQLSGLVSDPAKFAKRAAILIRLVQACQDLDSL